jgi:hypothetical protein
MTQQGPDGLQHSVATGTGGITRDRHRRRVEQVDRVLHRRPPERCVAEGEHTPVCCDQPVPTAVWRCRHAHDRLIQMDAASRPKERGVPVGEDAAIRSNQPVPATSAATATPSPRITVSVFMAPGPEVTPDGTACQRCPIANVRARRDDRSARQIDGDGRLSHSHIDGIGMER